MLYRIRELLLVLLLAFAAISLPSSYDGLQMVSANAAFVVAILVLVNAFFDVYVYGVRRYVSGGRSRVWLARLDVQGQPLRPPNKGKGLSL